MNKDSMLVLAWPSTPVRKVGMWYDAIPQKLGILKDGFYIAGHAAGAIINHETGDVRYFDFGRYHTPIKFGRVRDMEADPDLTFSVKAHIVDGRITNLEQILLTIAKNKACHGEGTMYASVCYGYSFAKAYKWAKNLQDQGAVHYGPFEPRGTNCSRFINQLLRAGKPALWTRIRMLLPLSITPTTKTNVYTSAHNNEYYTVDTDFTLQTHKMGYFNQMKKLIIPKLAYS